VAGCIISIRPTYSCADALTYLFTYLHSWLGANKTGNISETVEKRAKVTINDLYKVVHRLSIATKMYDLECRDGVSCQLYRTIHSFSSRLAFVVLCWLLLINTLID